MKLSISLNSRNISKVYQLSYLNCFELLEFLDCQSSNIINFTGTFINFEKRHEN